MLSVAGSLGQGARWVYMIKLWPIGLGRYARHALDIILGETYQEPQKKYNLWLKRKFNLRLKLQVTSGKLQAPSDTTCGCVDKFNKDLTCRIMHDTV